MERTDLFPLLHQQEVLPWLHDHGEVAYLIMDSFAELTDQQFVHRTEGWSFACHYTDLKHTVEFEREFKCVGLLPVETFVDVYQRFFEWVGARYPGRNVYFLHFPADLDSRALFKERAAALYDVMSHVATRYPFIMNVTVDNECVEPDDTMAFPYHYSKRTYRAFYDQWALARDRK